MAHARYADGRLADYGERLGQDLVEYALLAAAALVSVVDLIEFGA
jgi:hypothetical protein